jgi:drug/metabolite transporter (DMT)-like permease
MTNSRETGAPPLLGAAEWAMLVVLSVLWGGTFFFVAIAVPEVPPLTLVLLRVALAAGALLIYLAIVRVRLPRGGREWLVLAAIGLGNNVVPFSLIFWSQTQIPSGLASILNATTPLFSVVFAHFLARNERLTPARIGGALLGLGGVAVLMGYEALDGVGLAILAQLASLTASGTYAMMGIFIRRFATTPPAVTTAGQLICSTAMMLPVALIVDRPWLLPVPSAQAIAAIVALALLSTALGYLLFFRILATAGATNIMLVTFLIPVSALILGILVLGEQLAIRHFAGMALIGLGLAAIDGRPLTWLRFSRRT